MPPNPAPPAEAPADVLPPLLVTPPWTTREPGSSEPVVLKLKAPKEPTTVRWAPGQREEWTRKAHERTPAPDGDTDWTAVAAAFRAGEDVDRSLMSALLLHGPEETALSVLSGDRVFDTGWDWSTLFGIVARHELAALPMAMASAKTRTGGPGALRPFLDADVAQVMLRGFNPRHITSYPRDWCAQHGPAAARLIVPDALRKPGPKREGATVLLQEIADRHGGEAVIEAARTYGDEAARAIAALGLDPLDRYPDPLPEPGFDLAELPPVLLRDRRHRLPADAVRNLVTMLLISTTEEPYPGVEPVAAALDPASMAAFTLAMYEAAPRIKRWTSPGVEFALTRFGDDTTAERLAARVARWDKGMVWYFAGTLVLDVIAAIGTDTALRQLDMLARKSPDKKRMAPRAEALLRRIAEKRGLTGEQLADRLVPDLGLDASGGLTLDYGPRRFTVGFDEHLKPFVRDADGRRRATLPKPGAKDDPDLAPAAHRRFTELKKEARAVAADQIGRLETAMLTRRQWAAEEFETLFLRHPLLWHIARRLVWTAGGAAFRVAEDRTLADVHDDAFALPSGARVELPHPLRLPDLAAWSQMFADYEILQPFPQLGRTIHALTDKERDASRLERFEGRTVHYGRVLGLTQRGWKLGAKETGGFQRSVALQIDDERTVVIDLDPGVRVIGPDEYADQELTRVCLVASHYSRAERPFGALDPVTVSELLAALTRLTETSAS